jgi:hypothetical protein
MGSKSTACQNGMHHWRSTTSDVIRMCERCRVVEWLIDGEWTSPKRAHHLPHRNAEAHQVLWINEQKEKK